MLCHAAFYWMSVDVEEKSEFEYEWVREREIECAHCLNLMLFSFWSEWSECGENVKSWVQAVIAAKQARREFFNIFYDSMLSLQHIRSERLSSLFIKHIGGDSDFFFRKTQRIQQKKNVQFKLECYSEAKRSSKLARGNILLIAVKTV